jgi:hypothetical protein
MGKRGVPILRLRWFAMLLTDAVLGAAGFGVLLVASRLLKFRPSVLAARDTLSIAREPSTYR